MASRHSNQVQKTRHATPFNVNSVFLTDSQEYKTEVDLDDLETADENFCLERTPFGCQKEFSDLMLLIMEDNGFAMPQDVDEALFLYAT